jgi:hypothetical protein
MVDCRESLLRGDFSGRFDVIDFVSLKFRAFRVPRSVLAMLPILALAACFPSRNDLLQVTLSVEDNGVIYAGSARQRIQCFDAVSWLGGMSMGSCRTLGEAVFVNVGQHGPLFMTLTRDYIDVISKGSSNGSEWTIPLSAKVEMPQLVRFKDINNPATLVFVDPNNLQAEYGNQVRFKSIKVKKIILGTETRGKIMKVLPWLDKYRGNAALRDYSRKVLTEDVGAVRPNIFLGADGSKPKGQN